MEQLTYEAASKELEEILLELRNDEVNVDVLAIKVERASFLILFCKEKLANTETKVDQIIQKLEL